jgi:hypothetical protein
VRPPPVWGQHLSILRQTTVVPRNRIPHLKARILDARKQPMVRPVATKRQQVPAGTQDTQTLTRPRLTELLIFLWREIVPRASHERQTVGRVGDDGVRGVLRYLREPVETVAFVYVVRPRGNTVGHTLALLDLGMNGSADSNAPRAIRRFFDARVSATYHTRCSLRFALGVVSISFCIRLVTPS